MKATGNGSAKSKDGRLSNMKEIDSWLADPHRKYSIGLELYALAQCNKNILNLLRRKESGINMQKLVYELGKSQKVTITQKTIISLPELETITPGEVIEETFATQTKKQSLFFHELPPEIRPELLRANALFRENCYLKVSLNELPKEAETEAMTLQLQISDNFKENALCWSKIDFWTKYRQLPKNDLSQFDNFSPAQLLRKQQYLYQNISKMNSRLADNEVLRTKTDSVTQKNRLDKLVTKQGRELLKKNDELLMVTKLIEHK